MENKEYIIKMIPQELAKKLLEARKKIDTIEKGGYNEAQKYAYVKDETISNTVKKALDAVGVITQFNTIIKERTEYVSKSGSKGINTIVEVEYSFYDAETGEGFSGVSAGEGMDSGDKSLTKAITSAIKYILMKNFLIATGDDIERDSHEIGDYKKPKTIPPKIQKTVPPEAPIEVQKIVLTEELLSKDSYIKGINDAVSDGLTMPDIIKKLEAKHIIPANVREYLLHMLDTKHDE